MLRERGVSKRKTSMKKTRAHLTIAGPCQKTQSLNPYLLIGRPLLGLGSVKNREITTKGT